MLNALYEYFGSPVKAQDGTSPNGTAPTTAAVNTVAQETLHLFSIPLNPLSPDALSAQSGSQWVVLPPSRGEEWDSPTHQVFHPACEMVYVYFENQRFQVINGKHHWDLEVVVTEIETVLRTGSNSPDELKKRACTILSLVQAAICSSLEGVNQAIQDTQRSQDTLKKTVHTMQELAQEDALKWEREHPTYKTQDLEKIKELYRLVGECVASFEGASPDKQTLINERSPQVFNLQKNFSYLVRLPPLKETTLEKWVSGRQDLHDAIRKDGEAKTAKDGLKHDRAVKMESHQKELQKLENTVLQLKQKQQTLKGCQDRLSQVPQLLQESDASV